MIKTAIGFFILAIIAFMFGAYGIAGVSMNIGKILLGVFLVIAVISLLAGLFYNQGKRRHP